MGLPNGGRGAKITFTSGRLINRQRLVDHPGAVGALAHTMRADVAYAVSTCQAIYRVGIGSAVTVLNTGIVLWVSRPAPSRQTGACLPHLSSLCAGKPLVDSATNGLFYCSGDRSGAIEMQAPGLSTGLHRAKVN